MMELIDSRVPPMSRPRGWSGQTSWSRRTSIHWLGASLTMLSSSRMTPTLLFDVLGVEAGVAEHVDEEVEGLGEVGKGDLGPVGGDLPGRWSR